MNRPDQCLGPIDHRERLAILAVRMRVLNDRVGSMYEGHPADDFPDDLPGVLRECAAAAERVGSLLRVMGWEPMALMDGITAVVGMLSEDPTPEELERARGSVCELAGFAHDSLREAFGEAAA